MKTESVVKERYAQGAEAQQTALCCPIEYDRRYLEIIPDEVIERDYGCGDPSKHVRPGETVLDLGSGTGKICFIASQVAGDEKVPEEMQGDPELWSGCISGAFRENEFLRAFEDAGFYGIRVLNLDAEPWQTVKGYEFRSITVEAFKGKQGICLERNQAVIYKGPFKKVLDDDGHAMERGKRYAVCDKTFNLYKRPPYADSFEFIEPREAIPVEETGPFDCEGMRERHPRETKGQDYDATRESSACLGSDCC